MSEHIAVQVAYALPEQQVVVTLRVPSGTTVSEAIARSGIAQRIPEGSQLPQNYAIYGRIVKADQVVRSGDRVEILRPLQRNPKEARRQRAARQRAPSKRGTA